MKSDQFCVYKAPISISFFTTKAMLSKLSSLFSRKSQHERSTRDRPPIFRALGAKNPPTEIVAQSSDQYAGVYRLVDVYKHDSWAATARYANDQNEIVCKFNRQKSIGLLPMQWLGWFLARRETILLNKLRSIDSIPDPVGPMYYNGRLQRHVTAHVYVPGRPFKHDADIPDQFFHELTALIQQVHDCHVAFVDFHKCENILVGEDGRPHLIDFQIGFWRPQNRIAAWFTGGILKALQQSDQYHLLKHITRSRPNMCLAHMVSQRPWFIQLHRTVAIPFRTFRRRFLVAIRIRTGIGRVNTETQPEVAHRAA